MIIVANICNLIGILVSKMRLPRKQIALAGIAFFVGAFWLFALRFVLVNKTETHYHANFAIFVEGERIPFDNFTNYEEVAACFGGDQARPQDRVHLHDQISHVVHVHDPASTWGHLLANLNVTLGDTVFQYEDRVFVEGDDTEIRFLLNGEEVDSTANRVIGNEDVLLISVGEPTDDEIAEQYDEISQDAGEYNNKQDPSSCAGGQPLSFFDRVKAGLGLNIE